MSKVNASFKKLLDYEQRALAFQPAKGSSVKSNGEWAGVIFNVGDNRLTCSLDKVHEFLPPPPVTRVPGTKPWILGLANVRGELVTIVDLSCYFSGQPSTISMRSRILAADLRGRPVGLLVDEVFGQQDFNKKDAARANVASNSPLHAFISRQYKSSKEVWQVLDLDALFGTAEFLNGAASQGLVTGP